MPYSEMQTWSDLTTNPGIMGIFKVPDTESFKAGADTLPLTEPNNLGSILRTCSELDVNNWDDIKETIGLPSNIYIADNTVISSHSNDMENNDISDFLHTIPVLPYYGIDFTTNQHIILIIGGETEGISEESYKLAATLNGVRLNVPLSNNVDSLNTGTALGVIVFEIKRQLLSLRQSNGKK
ncbi:hypothetical protein NQ317_017466 [Molorchus minor]|uniref:tRNA/rRNA methyltransferase SpoU type domain-containing protein n=1 Tax=Molorchus minor TaxID=1323400 RepID=A0ABQ9IZF9_9CUCU|nr:hypothetical protein NQ317_017466 [Molorchus minor]